MYRENTGKLGRETQGSLFKEEGGSSMRHGDKGMSALSPENQLHGVDFHSIIQNEQASNTIEAATEFGFASQDIKKLKKRLERN
jgi:hypothetical protein